MPDKKGKNVDLSVIMPVFNQEGIIENSVKNLVKKEKKLNKLNIEIILIDDGSTDDTASICQKLSNRYDYVKYYRQDNKGVSSARNKGIKEAKGKYLFFLDADDELSPGTLWAVKNFFDDIEDETEIVTYPIETIFNGKHLKPHFRYQYLRESGVYDLTVLPYIGQTTMNIAVKNRFENNILFDEKQTFSEDQKYCCELLKEKLKMGFCAQGRYIYHRSDSSSSGRLSGACYIFEQCTSMFEEIFSWYPERVPLAFQGLFVNDYYWKMCCNILFPYHYDKDNYEKALIRLKKLLDRCDTEVILNHPSIDFFEKYYLLRMKSNSGMTWRINKEGFGLFYKDNCTVFENSIEIVMTRCKVIDGKVKIQGFLKSVFFQFYPYEPKLLAVENGGRINREISLRASTHNYYLSHEETQRFYAFTYECNPNESYNLKFEMRLEDKWFPTHYYFMPCVPFSHELKKYSFFMNGVKIDIDNNNCISFEREKKSCDEIILYYDCAGVSKDNGLIQFLKDRHLSDSAKRYYIISDDEQWNNLPDKKEGISFGSEFHKELFLNCSKIYTSFIEEKNIIPFPEEEYPKYADRFSFEVIYLQHGVLHIDMPWKYSSERLLADKIVISTDMEASLLKKYGYYENALIRTGMPRFENKIEKKSDGRRILFAPSWRAYLVGQYNNRKWESLDERFQMSNYYKELITLLKDKALNELLINNNLELDVKLHPIFRCYDKFFVNLPTKIHLVDQEDYLGNYKLFITDFSSYMYDFINAQIPVLFYLPDYNEFRSGMNGFREIADEGYWEKVITQKEKLIDKIIMELNIKNN